MQYSVNGEVTWFRILGQDWYGKTSIMDIALNGYDIEDLENLGLGLGESEKEAEKPSLDPVKKYEMNKIQQRLASHFGTKVALKADQKNRGEIKIPFQSASDLNRILEILEII